MTPPYLFLSFALLLTPGTRKRPPQSGFVQTGMWEITNDKSASIRQPHWHRHLDVKRPTLSCDLRRVVCSQSAVCRLYDRVDSGTHGRFSFLIQPNLPEQDFWPALLRVHPGHNFRLVRNTTEIPRGALNGPDGDFRVVAPV